jgi:hypothetical protein
MREDNRRALEGQESGFAAALNARDQVEQMLRDEVARLAAELEQARRRRGWLRR